MPFDWNEYTRLADELSKREDEASLRTAISRLYYSVYHQARDYLLEENVPLSMTDSSHKVVWKTYLRMGGSCSAVGRSGERMHDNRRTADYDKNAPDIRQLVCSTFALSRNLLTYLEQCRKSGEG